MPGVCGVLVSRSPLLSNNAHLVALPVCPALETLSAIGLRGNSSGDRVSATPCRCRTLRPDALARHINLGIPVCISGLPARQCENRSRRGEISTGLSPHRSRRSRFPPLQGFLPDPSAVTNWIAKCRRLPDALVHWMDSQSMSIAFNTFESDSAGDSIRNSVQTLRRGRAVDDPKSPSPLAWARLPVSARPLTRFTHDG